MVEVFLAAWLWWRWWCGADDAGVGGGDGDFVSGQGGGVVVCVFRLHSAP